VLVPPSFIRRSTSSERRYPETDELVAVGGIDLEQLSGSLPGRLQCSYDRANNTWRTVTAHLPDFIHHHGVAALDGRLFVIGT